LTLAKRRAKSGRRWTTVQLDAYATLVHSLHDLVGRDEVAGGAVVFDADALAVVGCDLADGVEALGPARWFFFGHYTRDLAADVLAELDVGDGNVDNFGEARGVGVVEVLGGGDAGDLRQAIGEGGFHFAALSVGESDLNAMGVVGAGSQLDAEGLGAIADQGRDVPIDAPLGHKAEVQLGDAFGR
jgi:hypothetical protein